MDIYNNKRLFGELWGKIAESIMTESIPNHKEEQHAQASPEQVARFMDVINRSEKKHRLEPVNEATDLQILENNTDDIVFSTIDRMENKWSHNNYMQRGKDSRNNDQNNRSINQQRSIDHGNWLAPIRQNFNRGHKMVQLLCRGVYIRGNPAPFYIGIVNGHGKNLKIVQ